MLNIRIVDNKHSQLIAGIIREAFKEQAAILSISRQKYPNYAAFETADRVNERIKRMDEKLVIAYLDGMPIGTVRFSTDSNDGQTGHINRLAVLPIYRGNKYGWQLLDFAEKQLFELGIKYIEIDMVAEFKELERFYENLGYVKISKKKFDTLPFEVLFLKKELC